MQANREQNILLTKTLRDPYYVLTNRDCQTRTFGGLFFEQCSERIFNDPNTAFELSFLARQLATRIRDPHLLTKATAMLGSAYRTEELYDRAKQFLGEAETLAADCTDCLAEVSRRRGVNLYYQRRFAEMCDALAFSFRCYEQLDDQDGMGRVLILRGPGYWQMGETERALEQEKEGLRLFSAHTPSRYYIAGMVNIACFLADPKEPVAEKLQQQRFDEALQYLQIIRDELKGHKRQHEHVRVHLRWIEGLICAVRDRRRAFRLLISARNGAKRLGLHSEYLAISADLAKLYKTGTPRTNDDQVIGIATECLECVHTTDKEENLLQTLCFDPQVATIEKLRGAVACRVPALL